MSRTWRYSLAGVGIGFLLGFVIVSVMAGPQPTNDTFGISLLIGSFLGGTGAVAGALIGGVADLLEYYRKRDEAMKDARANSSSEFRS